VGWRLDDEHFSEELDGGAEQMAGVAGGAVFLEADRDVDVWGNLVVVGGTAIRTGLERLTSTAPCGTIAWRIVSNILGGA
jgi:hypothetical protein